MTAHPVRRILLVALAGGVLVDVTVPGNAFGVNAPVVMAALLAAAFAVAGRDGLRRMDPADAWLAPSALVLAGLVAIRADDWLVLWDLGFAAALACGAITALAGGRVTRGVVIHVLELGVGVGIAAGVGGMTMAGVAWSRRRAEEAAREAVPMRGATEARVRAAAGQAAPVARGLVIAVPVVAVFALLFATADAVFARVAGELLAWRPDVDLVDVTGRSLVVGFCAWGAAGLLALGAGLLPTFMPSPETAPVNEPRPADAVAPGAGPVVASSIAPPAPPAPAAGPTGGWVSTPGPAPSRAATPRLGSAEASTVLVLLDVLFAGFVALQVAYLFGGLDTMAAAGLTYAEYARRGFFELVMVAVLAGMVVVTLDLAVARRSRLQLGASVVLMGLTAVVLASAFLRLRLYQQAYGWTELRFVVLVAIGWLAVGLGMILALLATRRTRWTLHVLGVLVLITIAGMNVVGPQAFVAERNLERAMNPSLVPAGGRSGLDAAYLEELGDEAVPSVVAAWDRLRPGDRDELGSFLTARHIALTTDPGYQGWPAWNLARERALAALDAWDPAHGAASH